MKYCFNISILIILSICPAFTQSKIPTDQNVSRCIIAVEDLMLTNGTKTFEDLVGPTDSKAKDLIAIEDLIRLAASTAEAKDLITLDDLFRLGASTAEAKDLVAVDEILRLAASTAGVKDGIYIEDLVRTSSDNQLDEIAFEDLVKLAIIEVLHEKLERTGSVNSSDFAGPLDLLVPAL